MTTDRSPAAWLSAARFHRCFVLRNPAVTGRAAVRVTYSDIGHQASADKDTESDHAVVVFIGGLMGGRYTVLHLDDYCRQSGIRVITVDRPGMGGSEHVSLDKRIAVWLATFEALLRHLKINKVAIASHSGGAIYAMNTLVHHRRYLDPNQPSVAFFAPYCHPSQSGAMTTTTLVLQALPAAAITRLDSFARMSQSVTKSFSWSSSVLTPAKLPHDYEQDDTDWRNRELNMGWWAGVSKLALEYFLAEDISGSSDEALLYLRKARPRLTWGQGRWEEYSDAAYTIATDQPSSSPLRISTYHAASDNMIGLKGALYFDSCWQGIVDGIKYTSQTCENTDHDTIIAPDKPALKHWLSTLVGR